jgi:hypothetical protein
MFALELEIDLLLDALQLLMLSAETSISKKQNFSFYPILFKIVLVFYISVYLITMRILFRFPNNIVLLLPL